MFGGTTEGRTLSHALAALGAEVTVCVATAYGAEEQGAAEGITVRTGRQSAEEKRTLLRGAALCVDATHPYAAAVSGHLRIACEETGVPYRRVLRASCEAEGARVVPDAQTAAAYLSGTAGSILLTTGAKELPAFAGLDPARLYPRVLPSHESLAACEAAGIPHRNIIAMQGPFSRELNEALIRQYGIRFVVSKDGGKAGGFPEKAEAAQAAGAELLVLRRPEESGSRPEDIIRECEELLCK